MNDTGQRNPRTAGLESQARRAGFWSRTVGRRLFLGFSLVLLLMVGTLATDVYASNQQDGQTKLLLNQLIPARVAAKGVLYGVRATDDDGAWLMMSRIPKQEAELLNTYYNVDLPSIDNNLQALDNGATTPAQHGFVTQFRSFWYSPTGYLAGDESVFGLKAQGKFQAATDAYVQVPYVRGLDAILNYQAAKQGEIDKALQDEANAANLVKTLSVTLGIMAVVLGALIAFLLTRSIVGPLRRLTASAQLVARGDTSVRIDVSRTDELGVLARSFQAVSHYLARIAGAATAVSGGDLTQSVPLAGDADALGLAFNSMVIDLQARTDALVHAEKRTRETADSLARGVTQLIEELAPATEGDLTIRPTMSAEAGDIAVIADFTGVLITTFSDVAKSVRGASSQVQFTSEQLSSRVKQLAREVQERTIQVNETAAIAEQIADSATDVLNSVAQVNRSTEEAVESVEQGNSAVAQTLERMDAMRATMIQATRQIKKLSDSSLAMNSTVGLVLQFAGDLELLADNAQIEAARHREAGGVFTAVAEQTGRLAEDAQKALTDIQFAVLTNRQETAEVGRQMEQVATEVVASARAVEDARAAFNNITRTVRELRGFVDRVQTVATAQVDMANAVNAAMQQIITFFGQTAAGVQLSEVDARQLGQTIEGLRASISNLKVDEDVIVGARAA